MSYHHQNLREALIEATLELINQQNDLSSVSLRKVARQLGVSHAAPYRHFADKEALLAAVAEEGFRKLTNCLNQSVEQTPDHPLQQLQVTGVAYVQFAVRHPSHYRVMFSAFQFEPLTFPSLKAAGEETFTVLANIIQRGQEVGVIKTSHPRQLT